MYLIELLISSQSLSIITPVTVCLRVDWIVSGDKEFLFSTTRTRTWPEARLTCNDHGGDLASIVSQEEQDFVERHTDDT